MRLFVLAFVLLVSFPGAAWSQIGGPSVFPVTSDQDSGPGSLRQAIALAQDGDIVRFKPAMAGRTIRLLSELEVINKGIHIVGILGDPPILDGQRSTRILYSRCSDCELQIQDLVFMNGDAAADGRCYGGGGAICSENVELTVTRSLFEGNRSQFGGAIFSAAKHRRVVVSDSQFVENRSLTGFARGGAIATVHGELLLEWSSFLGNHANAGGAVAQDNGVLALTDCDFQGNSAQYGSALYTIESDSIRVGQSSFFFNYEAGGRGPLLDLSLANHGEYVEIANSSLAFNETVSAIRLAGGHSAASFDVVSATILGLTPFGGAADLLGIRADSAQGPLRVHNSILSGFRSDVVADGVSGAYNFTERPSDLPCGPTDTCGQQAWSWLEPMEAEANGTWALRPSLAAGSPLIDKGRILGEFDTDQRAEVRRQGTLLPPSAWPGDGSDIGAIERAE